MIENNDLAKLNNEKIIILMKKNNFFLEKKIDFNYIYKKIVN